jgi:hypothetical protein
VTYGLISPSCRCVSINANDFNAFAHPIGRQVDPTTAVSFRFDFLFDHLNPEEPELGLWEFAGLLWLSADLF